MMYTYDFHVLTDGTALVKGTAVGYQNKQI